MINTKTGEFNSYKSAYYRGLEFKIYEPTEKTNYRRLTIEGSLHKYWNNGAHNFNDFGIGEVYKVVNELEYLFNIDISFCTLRQLEIGVNINPPVSTKQILKACIKYKTNDIKWVYTSDEGNYIQATNQRHFIKIYDKKTHYTNKGFQIENDIMRIEKKWRKMVELNDKGIYTLKDLLNYGLSNFKQDLLKEWSNVLYCDFNTVKGTKYEDKYTNVNWWERLSYDKLKYHRNNLNKMIKNDSDNFKNQISRLSSSKVDFLNMETSEINPLYIGLKKGVCTNDKQDINRRFCLITGLNISMQKSNSFLLSHTGLKYYYKTDKKVFLEVKSKYLSVKWIEANHKIQIKEIAHNIRNKYNNNLLS
ncbi:MAG: hypothetical protein WAO74_13000, partial [Polaribacter sp.]|uniref:hypothetical protein n=1 Tax=Polaribacter sp. TaxID=1920175 RepID=UPI003BB1D410